MSVELIGEDFNKSSEESLEESIEAFRDAHRKNTDEILNIHEKKKKNSTRTYVFQPFPMILYHADGREIVVGHMEHPDAVRQARTADQVRTLSLKFSQKEVEDAEALGFRREHFIKPRVSMLSPLEEKASADRRFAELSEQNRQLADTVARLQSMLEKALTAPRE